jgi:hypothetical protein
LGSDNAKEGSGALGKMIIFATEKSRVILLPLLVSPNAFAVASKSLWKQATLTLQHCEKREIVNEPKVKNRVQSLPQYYCMYELVRFLRERESNRKQP